jgi:hypothetical protein
VKGVCEVCGTPFEGTTKRRYCSHKCAVKAHRAGMSKPHKATEEAQDGN